MKQDQSWEAAQAAETESRKGHNGGPARTREVKLTAVFTQTTTDRRDGPFGSGLGRGGICGGAPYLRYMTMSSSGCTIVTLSVSPDRAVQPPDLSGFRPVPWQFEHFPCPCICHTDRRCWFPCSRGNSRSHRMQSTCAVRVPFDSPFVRTPTLCAFFDTHRGSSCDPDCSAESTFSVHRTPSIYRRVGAPGLGGRQRDCFVQPDPPRGCITPRTRKCQMLSTSSRSRESHDCPILSSALQ